MLTGERKSSPRRDETNTQKATLVPFYCQKCGRLLVYAVPFAEAWCPECHIWDKATKVTAKKTAKGTGGWVKT